MAPILCIDRRITPLVASPRGALPMHNIGAITAVMADALLKDTVLNHSLQFTQAATRGKKVWINCKISCFFPVSSFLDVSAVLHCNTDSWREFLGF